MMQLLRNMWGSMYFIKMFCRNGCNCYCKCCRKVVSVKCVCNRNWHIAEFLFITTYPFKHFNAVNFTSVLNGDGRLITYMTFSKVEILFIYTYNEYNDFTTICKYLRPEILWLHNQPTWKIKISKNWSSESENWQAKFSTSWIHIIETLTLNRTLCNTSLIMSNIKFIVWNISNDWVNKTIYLLYI